MGFTCSSSKLSMCYPTSYAVTNEVENTDSDQTLAGRPFALTRRQTMDMYSSASKEALNTKGRFEEARSAEATVLAIPKMEKAKSRATMEASEKAQMMVELEGSKLK
ncbi:hypothetical protein HID58_052119 [Brassica napus]|uniref:Uncharacterized protein n=1 Tax=Brassica napus TaxID=3708 RepID=A0ABQ8ACC1_BRANA|nr:hypothetical protein HID58_052119 [Brassica napus]